MRKAGQDTTSATAFFYLSIECDGVRFIRDALSKSGSPTTQGLHAGVDALGASFESAAVPSMTWQPGRFDGVTAWRDVHYASGRFIYTGELHRV